MTRAVERVMRRERAARDAAILVEASVDDDLDDLAAIVARLPLDELG